MRLPHRRESDRHFEKRSRLKRERLPDEDFDYDDFIRREFGQSEGAGHRIGLTKEQFWRLVAAFLLAVMILGYFISAR